ncbi:hypothetical protein HTIA_0265 [Halorhabdus tiamatea SARL4B]|uniref:Uncharacterized protein n=1 Tax=Halorhabdus tiamatea SARL4B TaxID=1033806 RepID=F7PHN6_9EURY|nr:hypothetical protein HTIA_0265 [Halorhabdus tiamatea SARL4B]
MLAPDLKFDTGVRRRVNHRHVSRIADSVIADGYERSIPA